MPNVARFLLPEPPREEDHAATLFVDRQEELALARAQVAGVAQDDLGRPMALVGQARTGKSHLLRRLVQEVRGGFAVTVQVAVSTGLKASRDVLREILNQVYTAQHNAVLERGLGQPEGDGPLAPLERILHELSGAISGTTSEISLSRARTVGLTITQTAGVGIKVPLLVAHVGKGELSATATSAEQRAESLSDQRTIKVNRFEEQHLTELIGMAHALVALAQPGWRTLLVIDDFDLLQRDERGAFDPETLLQALATLASIPGFFVLTTVRQDTYRRHVKDFHRVAHVAPFADDAHLVEIYQRHVAAYHDGQDPFAGGFVHEAARLSEGRPGIFLSHLREAFETVPGMQARQALDLRGWVDQQWREVFDQEPELARRIEQAVRAGGGRIAQGDLQALRTSYLMRWVVEDYTSEATAKVDPILASVLRTAQAGT